MGLLAEIVVPSVGRLTENEELMVVPRVGFETDAELTVVVALAVVDVSK